MDATQVLVIEDDAATAAFLADNLRADGYMVRVAEAVGQALRAIELSQPDLVLLDVILDEGSGLELLDLVRGADDYLVKPFSYPELVARMQAVLRRSAARPLRGVIRVGDLWIDPVGRKVEVAGRAVHLTAREFDLLHVLARQPTRVHTKGELLRDVWGYASTGVSRTVDTHACRLRQKLAGGRRPLVVTVRGVGYRLVEDLP